jgi:hypothetical protein
MPLFEIGGLPLGLQVMGFGGYDTDVFSVSAGLRPAAA